MNNNNNRRIIKNIIDFNIKRLKSNLNILLTQRNKIKSNILAKNEEIERYYPKSLLTSDLFLDSKIISDGRNNLNEIRSITKDITERLSFLKKLRKDIMAGKIDIYKGLELPDDIVNLEVFECDTDIHKYINFNSCIMFNFKNKRYGYNIVKLIKLLTGEEYQSVIKFNKNENNIELDYFLDKSTINQNGMIFLDMYGKIHSNNFIDYPNINRLKIPFRLLYYNSLNNSDGIIRNGF